MRNYLMMYHKRDVLIAILLSVLIIDLSILMITFVPVIYAVCLPGFHIDVLTGKTNDQIFKAFTTICAYLSIFHFGALKVPYFHLTNHTLIHFRDVKHLFIAFQLYVPVAVIALIILIRRALKDHEIMFLKLTVVITGIILAVFAFFGITDFSSAFVLMHQLLFRNNYWLIDPMKDPIINIFPEDFFKYCLFGILGIIVIANGIVLIIYEREKKKLMAVKE